MMVWLSIMLMVLMAVGIILLSKSSPLEGRSREIFLEKLTKLVDGTCEPIYEWDNSFRIEFVLEGVRFVYEDLESPGFKERLNKAYLKHFSPLDFTLTFAEDPKVTAIKSDILTVSDVTEETVEKTEKMDAPDEFDEFIIFSNDCNMANRLFDDKKFVKVFSSFKNYNERKLPFMPLKILDGVIVLEFQLPKEHNPSLENLHLDVHSLEDYLDKMMILVRSLKAAYLEKNA